MKLVSSWDDNESLYSEVEISAGRYVTVKQPDPEKGFMYVLQNNDGSEAYDYKGNTYESKQDSSKAVDFVRSLRK